MWWRRSTPTSRCPPGKTDDLGFQDILDKVFALFGAPGTRRHRGGHARAGQPRAAPARLQQQAEQRGVRAEARANPELDEAGAYILPCTRNVFLKYYTAADQQLSIWGPQDQEPYYEKCFGRSSRSCSQTVRQRSCEDEVQTSTEGLPDHVPRALRRTGG